MDLIETIVQYDKALMIFLNGFNSPFWDKLMIVISAKLTWVPLYLLIVYTLIRRYKKNSIILIAAILLSVGAADQIASGLFKPTVKRLRPCHDVGINNELNIPNNCGGQYGFFSSHASTTFAVAMFLVFAFGKTSWYFKYAWVWASIVSYSRIYLGVHYPLDVLFGALTGVGVSYLFFIISRKLLLKWSFYL